MKKELIIGLFGLITLAGFLWGYKFLEGKNVFGKDSYYHVSYENVANLGVSSEVQIKGFKVGNVTNVELDPLDINKIKVEFSVNSEIRLPKNTIAAIKTGGVMGDKSIELLFDQVCTTGCAESGDELPGGSVGLIQSMIPDKELDHFFKAVSDGAKGLTDGINLDTGNVIKHTIQNLEQTSIRLAVMTNKINKMIDQSNKSLQQTLNNTASITSNFANNNTKITSILSGLQTTISKINGKLDQTFDNTNGSIVAVKSSLEKIDLTFGEVNTLLKSISTGDGTINRLLHNKKTADDLDFALQNLGLLLQDLRLNPKRYVNVSVFGKKQKSYDSPTNDPAFNK